MAIAFHCPSCDANRSASEWLSGRRVRCPDCDALVEVPTESTELSQDDALRTVAMAPLESDGSETVMLQAVDVIPEPQPAAPVRRPPSSPPPGPPPQAAVEEDEGGGLEQREVMEDTEMDMTPMVDVTFLLLIFFMVTAAFTLQRSIEVPKPQDDAPSESVQDDEEQSDRVTVQVDEFNTYHVITIDWEEEAPSPQELLRYLRQARDGDSTGRVPTTLLVEANGEALHEKVVAALDAGSQTGFNEVLLATVEEE